MEQCTVSSLLYARFVFIISPTYKLESSDGKLGGLLVNCCVSNFLNHLNEHMIPMELRYACHHFCETQSKGFRVMGIFFRNSHVSLFLVTE